MAKTRLRNADRSLVRNSERLRTAAAGKAIEVTEAGTVLKSTGSWYWIGMDALLADGTTEVLQAKVRGRLRLKGSTTTNPIAVGDRVGIVRGAVQIAEASIQVEGESPLPTLNANENIHVIATREDRRNYIIRKATNLSREAHVIAANLDQAVMVVTLVAPRVSTGFIDRFLVTAAAYDIPAALILNKMDVYADIPELSELVEELESVYVPLGYPVYKTSAALREGIEPVREMLRGKTTLLMGHSGVGKSTLANVIDPSLDLKTAEISLYSMKGKHTTTFAEMHPLPAEKGGGWVVDTPGIKELGIVDIAPVEIGTYFPEIRRLADHCKFHNCLHQSEPGCAVRPAVERGEIAISRYASYLSIIAGEDQYN